MRSQCFFSEGKIPLLKLCINFLLRMFIYSMFPSIWSRVLSTVKLFIMALNFSLFRFLSSSYLYFSWFKFWATRAGLAIFIDFDRIELSRCLKFLFLITRGERYKPLYFLAIPVDEVSSEASGSGILALELFGDLVAEEVIRPKECVLDPWLIWQLSIFNYLYFWSTLGNFKPPE